MIKTIYTTTCSEQVVTATEIMLQKEYPGLHLIRESKDINTNQWVYGRWFEQAKDYTWFKLKNQ